MHKQTTLVRLAISCTLLCTASMASATLFVEPVFNSVAGTGPDATVVGLYNPDLINPSTGEPFAISNAPGVISVYPAGFPPDPVLADVIRFFNNTPYTITGFVLDIVGTAVEPVPFDFTITLNPTVDAFFGDVDGNTLVGISDIFSTIVVSNSGRTITFSDGLIAPGQRFTDFNLASTTDGEPFLAAFNAYFTGFRSVPEPPIALLLGGGLLAVAASRLRRRRQDR